MKRKYKILILIALIIPLYGSSFSISYAQELTCVTRVIHIIQLPPILGCFNDRITALENKPSSTFTDSTTASNLGSIGQGIFAQEVGDDLQFKKLTNGTGIILQSNGTRIMINSTASGGGEANTASNVGTFGQGVFAQKVGVDLQFKKLLSQSSCIVTANNSTNVSVIFDPEGVCKEKRISHEQVSITQSQTKTNIGTAYVDIYTTTFEQEDQGYIFYGNSTYYHVGFMYDYVGTGTHQCRFVNVADNTNILWESPTFTSDQNSMLSGWFFRPSWLGTLEILSPAGLVNIEVQCKSTVAADDPIFKGYKIFSK